MAAENAPLAVTLTANTQPFEKEIAKAMRAMQRELDALKKKAAANDNILPKIPPNYGQQFQQVGQQAAGGMRQASQAAGQLTFQLNDISTSLAGGMSPFMVMMQQGSQVTQVLNGLTATTAGVGGKIRLMASVAGSALMSMLNPINLVVMGLILAVGWAYKYFTTTEDGADKANKELKKHAQELDAVIGKYGDLAPKAKAVLQAMQDTDKAKEAVKTLSTAADAIKTDAVTKLNDSITNTKGISNETKKAIQAAFGDRTIVANLIAGMEEVVATIERGEDPTDKIKTLMQGIDTIQMKAPGAGLEHINTTLLAILPLWDQYKVRQEAVIELQDAINEKTEKMVTSLANMAGPLGPLIEALHQLSGGLDVLGTLSSLPGKLFQLPAAMSDLSTQAVTATPTASKTFLKTKAATAEIAATLDRLDDETAKAFAKLFTILPPTAKITSGVRTFEEQARARWRYEHGQGGLAAQPGHSRHEMGTFREGGAALDIGQGVDMNVLREAVRMVPELEQLDRVSEATYQKDKVHVQLAGEARKAQVKMAEDQVEAEQALADAKAKGTQNILDRISALDEEASLQTRINEINTTSGLNADQKRIAITVETELQKALNQAKKDGITLSQQEIAQIRERAAAAEMAKIAGDTITDAVKREEDARKKQLDTMKQMDAQFTGVVQSSLSGFIKDMIAGKDASEALSDALGKVAEAALDMALQLAFTSLFGGGTGGGGGGLLSMLFGVGHKGGIVGKSAFPTRRVNPAVFAGAERMHSGGVVGLRTGEVPIIAQRGEIILPKGATGGAGMGGSVTNNIGNISVDMSKSGAVAADTQSGRDLGIMISKSVQAIIIKESRPGGLLRQAPLRS